MTPARTGRSPTARQACGGCGPAGTASCTRSARTPSRSGISPARAYSWLAGIPHGAGSRRHPGWLIMNLRCEPVRTPGAVPDRAGADRGRRPKRARPWSGGPAPLSGVGPVPVPNAVIAGRDEQRGEGGAGQFRVAARDHRCGHVMVVPGDLLRDRPAGWQACRHDLGRAEREVQVLRVLPGLAEDPLRDLAARGGVLAGQPVEQLEGVVAIEGARSPRPHPGTVPVASHDVRRHTAGQP